MVVGVAQPARDVHQRAVEPWGNSDLWPPRAAGGRCAGTRSWAPSSRAVAATSRSAGTRPRAWWLPAAQRRMPWSMPVRMNTRLRIESRAACRIASGRLTKRSLSAPAISARPVDRRSSRMPFTITRKLSRSAPAPGRSLVEMQPSCPAAPRDDARTSTWSRWCLDPSSAASAAWCPSSTRPQRSTRQRSRPCRAPRGEGTPPRPRGGIVDRRGAARPRAPARVDQNDVDLHFTGLFVCGTRRRTLAGRMSR